MNIIQISNFKRSSARLKIRKIYWLIYLLFTAACGEGPPAEMPVVDKAFRTTPPSRIFFKNIRSTAYQWEQIPGSRTDYYLLRKIANAPSRPVLYPVIADIWMEEQAQLIWRSGLHDSLPLPLSVHWTGQNDSGTYHLENLNTRQNYELGLNLYNALRKGYSLQISFMDGEKRPLFTSPDERTFLLISLQDYLRLTEYFK